MTKKGKKEKNIDDINQLTEDKNNLKGSTKTNSNNEIEDPTTVEKEEEIKLLEGEEQKVLDYFSKDDLVGKIKDLEEKLKKKDEEAEKFKSESNTWKDKYMRLQAEFENAQKRWNKIKQDLRLEYTASTIKSFLPLYDSFKKALQDDNKNKEVLKGFYDQFMNILKSYKAEPIEVKINDPFDYSYHDALSSVETKDVPSNIILEIIQDGWKLDKDVIRYAKVIISKEPKPPEIEPESEMDIEGDQEQVLEKTELDKSEESSEKKEKKSIEDSNPDYIS
ncbi:MAG: nucleotide exchange factor GrpE [Candidatus Heimdallarchaeota archaeon]